MILILKILILNSYKKINILKDYDIGPKTKRFN